MSEKTREVKNFKIQCILKVCMVKLSMNISRLNTVNNVSAIQNDSAEKVESSSQPFQNYNVRGTVRICQTLLHWGKTVDRQAFNATHRVWQSTGGNDG